MSWCRIDTCDREAVARGLCWPHYRRDVRGQDVDGPIHERPKTPWERLVGAIHAYMNVDDTDADGWERARDRLRKAAIAYALSLPRFGGLSSRRG